MRKLLQQKQDQVNIMTASLLLDRDNGFVLYALAVAFAGAFYFYSYYFFNILRRMLLWSGG